ncbi:hypothetical protein CBR_g23385 [Chara braunii]|uniref:Uncharacterized protein n=1 Tax=Chara braunii TaxID=69332 RepID=A0A388L418_CHABU|nr:hypothetical protein CBR_g23385 [Chara braunii]|eukprot:GBG77059.1 hypothetical protein CBR_g23385 [Chara braunii]
MMVDIFTCAAGSTVAAWTNLLVRRGTTISTTTCFDSGGVELPGNYKKVLLHLSRFAGYGMNAVALPPFDRSKKLKVVEMVGPIKFLRKTPCYRVTGYKRRKKASSRDKDEENAECDTRGVPSSSHCPDGDDGDDEGEGKSSEEGTEEGSTHVDAREDVGDERESGEDDGDDSASEDEGGEDEGENGEEEENAGDAEETTAHGRKNKGRDEESEEDEIGGETNRDVEHLERELEKPEKERHEQPAKNARKKVRFEGTKEVADFGDEGVGVDPRDHTARAGKLESHVFDTTTCFFLEYDGDGNAVQRPQEIYVDCMKILPNPVGDHVQYNHRPQEIYVDCMKILPNPVGDPVQYNHRPLNGMLVVFRDLTAREKEMVLVMILDCQVVVTTGQTFNNNLLNMDNIRVEVRRERYMIRLFNYVIFKTESRKENEWNNEFFIGYSYIMDIFAPTGLTKEQWEENKTKVPAHKAKDVSRRLGGIDEPKVGKVGGFKLTRTLYAECPYYLKVFMHEIIGAIDHLRDELRRISANARHVMWDTNNDHTTFLPICLAPYEALQPSEEITRVVKKLNCRLAVLDLCPRKSTASHEWSDERFVVLPEMMKTFCDTDCVIVIFSMLRVEQTVLKNVLRWDHVKMIPGRWERYFEKDQYVVSAGNLPLRPQDCMTIVMHASDNDYKKVTVQPRNHVTWFDDNVK